MLGPQAWENLYQTNPPAAAGKGYVISHGNKEYTYQLHMPEMFESLWDWFDWCEDDVANNNGEYADKIEDTSN